MLTQGSSVLGPGRRGGKKKHLQLSTRAAQRHACTHIHRDTCIYTQRHHTQRHAHTQRHTYTHRDITHTDMHTHRDTSAHTWASGPEWVGGPQHVGGGRVLLPHKDHRGQVNPPLRDECVYTGHRGAQPFPINQSRDEATLCHQPSSQRTGRTHKGKRLPRVPHPSCTKQ